MEFPIFDYELDIREHHLDSFGHVNNATYLSLFEEARWDVITRNGYGFQEVHRTGQGPVILEAHLWFRQELRLRQRIRITTQIASHERRTGKMTQRMLDQGTLCCEAQFVFGLFDLKQRKLVEPTNAWRRALGLPQQQTP
jgi:acyl-CoA thioester hydrolase